MGDFQLKKIIFKYKFVYKNSYCIIVIPIMYSNIRFKILYFFHDWQWKNIEEKKVFDFYYITKSSPKLFINSHYIVHQTSKKKIVNIESSQIVWEERSIILFYHKENLCSLKKKIPYYENRRKPFFKCFSQTCKYNYIWLVWFEQ